MREPIFRIASDGDLPGIRDVVESALAQFGLIPDPSGVDADLESVERSFIEPGGRFWVLAERGGRVIGCVGVMKKGADECELRKMYLVPEWRGKGWGRLLLDESLAFAREHGYRKMTLDTHSVLVDAIAMYRRYGFQPVPIAEHLCSRCDLAFELEL